MAVWGLGAVWLAASGTVLWFWGVTALLGMLAVLGPLLVLWAVAEGLRARAAVQALGGEMQAVLEGMRRSQAEERRARGTGGAESAVERRLAEIAKIVKETESSLALLRSSRVGEGPGLPGLTAELPDEAEEAQPALSLGTPAEVLAPPVAKADLIRALNFPDSESDDESFAALRRALKDRSARQLIQGSQDVLTLLSQDGIYMDDLRPDLARPEIWRRFAQGERGRAVSGLGGVRDRSSLALTAGRMREDTIFRDAAHHFLRRFDRMLEQFEKIASDEEIIALSDTRTGRAFMLLGRVTGTFD